MDKSADEEALIRRILRKTRLFGDGRPKGPSAEELEVAAKMRKSEALAADKAAYEEKQRLSRERHESLLTKPRDCMGRDEYHPGYLGPAHIAPGDNPVYKVKVAKDGIATGIGIHIDTPGRRIMDADLITATGSYKTIAGAANVPTAAPVSIEHYLTEDGRVTQECTSDNGDAWFRNRAKDGSWGPWFRKGGLLSGSMISTAKIGAGMITSGLSGIGIGIGEAGVLKEKKMREAHDKAIAATIIAKEKRRAEKEEVLEDRFADVILAELSKFGPDTGEDVNVTAVFGRVLTSMKELAALSGTSLEEILEKFEMTEEKSPKIIALEELAAQMTAYWQDPEFSLEPQPFDLNTSKSLTVWKGDKGAYSKHSHIGGESFVPTKAHVGKRGHIILTFNAVATEPYSWMEMPLTDGLVDLTKFQAHFINAGFAEKWNAVLQVEQDARKAALQAEHGDKYADFGSY